MKIKTLLIALIGAGLLSACSSHQNNLGYFQNVDSLRTEIPVEPSQYLTKVQTDDELFINVNSVDPHASALFNMPSVNPAIAENGVETKSTSQNATYIVDSKGYIDFPVLGEIKVAGMTIEQVKETIENRVKEYVQNPLVTIRLVNFKVDVAGEVATPGIYPVTRERYSVLDALSAAGDLTPFGERSNVLLIREENGKRVAHRLNLNSADVLSSPYFYVMQNDYIYVEPNKIREDNSKYNQNNAYKLSVTSTIVSAASVIASLVIALAVK